MLAGPGLTTAAAASTSLLYSGEQTDRTGLQYLRARYYDPRSGRFNRLDPFAGNTSDPQSLHKYLYAHGDPVNGIDPSGEYVFIGGILNSVRDLLSSAAYAQVTQPGSAGAIPKTTVQGKFSVVGIWVSTTNMPDVFQIEKDRIQRNMQGILDKAGLPILVVIIIGDPPPDELLEKSRVNRRETWSHAVYWDDVILYGRRRNAYTPDRAKTFVDPKENRDSRKILGNQSANVFYANSLVSQRFPVA
jgi:RHS repeat-associated protein